MGLGEQAVQISVDAPGGILGRSPGIRSVLEVVERVAPTDATVLVTGETGTGRELVARALHERSDRAEGPFVAVNSAALAEGLLESELFGHIRGAFTGAVRDRRGLFESADGGTILLDEVGDMSGACSTGCCACCRSGRSRRWGRRGRCRSTCAWLPQPTETFAPRWKRVASATTCTTG